MKPLLYRPSPKLSLGCAFGIAAAIHISALAFSPSTHPDAVGSEDGTSIELEDPAPPEPDASPETQDAPVVSETPPAFDDNDFFPESQPTPRIRRKAGPIHAQTSPTRSTVPAGNGKAFALNAPRPTYPYEARAHHVTGHGLALLQVDSSSGAVTSVNMAQTTGSPLLDRAAISAFERWRFRTGTPSTVRIPITFTMFGAQL